MNRKGLTVIELLVVISILVILTAITYPSLSAAKHRAKITASAAKLKQVYTWLHIYRNGYGEEVAYGYPAQMGLPDKSGFGEPAWMTAPSPCGNHPVLQKDTRAFILTTLCNSTDADRPRCLKSVADDIVLYHENYVLLMDLNCTDPNNNYNARFQEKFGIGIMLGGNLKTRRAIGDVFKPGWWANPE